MGKYFVIASLCLMVVASIKGESADCGPLHLGCFKPIEKNILFSDRPEHDTEDFFSETKLDWENFDSYLLDAACRCEKAASSQGYKFFSLRDFGVCHGIGKNKKKFEDMKLEMAQVCIGTDYQECDSSKHKGCVSGDKSGEFVYQVTIEPSIKVVDGGYTAWTKWSKCTKTCGGGIQERERACTNPKPVGDTAKDCSVLGEPREVRKCNTKPCPVNKKPKDSTHRAIFCENRGIGTIKCPNRYQKIQVLGANYGRLDTMICQIGNHKRTHCRADRSDLQMKEACNGKNSCQINPSNTVYGDPCPGISKYASIEYRCSYRDPSVREFVACQHRGVKKLSCPGKQKIHVIGALYGRLSTDYCRFGNFRRTYCRAPKSHQQIKHICNGKNACHINPHNAVYGDPCPGITKYAAVRYSCH